MVTRLFSVSRLWINGLFFQESTKPSEAQVRAAFLELLSKYNLEQEFTELSSQKQQLSYSYLLYGKAKANIHEQHSLNSWNVLSRLKDALVSMPLSGIDVVVHQIDTCIQDEQRLEVSWGNLLLDTFLTFDVVLQTDVWPNRGVTVVVADASTNNILSLLTLPLPLGGREHLNIQFKYITQPGSYKVYALPGSFDSLDAVSIKMSGPGVNSHEYELR